MYKYSLIILGIICAACSTAPEIKKSKTKAVPVFVASVEKQEIPLFIEAIGTLSPIISIDIRPQVSGKLQAIHFKEGQRVERYQPLFSIDARSYQIKLQEAEALLKQNRAIYEASKKKLDRYESLAKKDLIPQLEWDELMSLVAVNEAQISAGEARVQSAQLDLDHCQICSPIKGRIGKASIDADNLVLASTTPLVNVLFTDQLNVKFNLSESDYLQLAKDEKVYQIKVISLVNSALSAQGEVYFIDHNFHSESGLLHLEGRIPNESLEFLPGQSVKVLISLSTIPDAKVIPQKSVRMNQSGAYVYLINENKAEVRQITTGEEIEDKVMVVEGLEFGDKVVTDGHLRLSPGTEVEIK